MLIIIFNIVVMHSCPATALRHKALNFERSISSKMDKRWQALRVYSSKTIHQIYLQFSINAHGSLFKY